MKSQIPASVIAVVAEITSSRETHATLDSLYMYAGAPGEPPEGSKHAKALAWLRLVNKEDSIEPFEVLGQIIEGYMEEELDENNIYDKDKIKDKKKLIKTLQNAKLQYVNGGRIIGALAAPSTSLEDSIKKRNITVLNEEFDRALRTVETSPKVRGQA